MAENTQETAKKEKKGFFKSIVRSFRDTRGEMKRVVWPTKKQALNNTIVVLVFMAIMAVVISVFDFGVSGLIALFLRRGA